MTERLFAQESLRTSFLTHRSVSKTRWHFTCSVEGTLRCELGLRLEAQWTPPHSHPHPQEQSPSSFLFCSAGALCVCFSNCNTQASVVVT